MASDIDTVHDVVGGSGFNLKDSTGVRWLSLTYRTREEADAAREKIVEATKGVIDSHVSAPVDGGRGVADLRQYWVDRLALSPLVAADFRRQRRDYRSARSGASC